MSALPVIIFVSSEDTTFLTNGQEDPVRAVKINGISFLLAKSASDIGLCPFGVSLETTGKMEVTYVTQSTDGGLEEALGKLAAKFCNEPELELATGINLTNLITIGRTSLYAEWATLLESWRVPEATFISKELQSGLGVHLTATLYERPFLPVETEGTSRKEWLKKYKTFDQVLENFPIHYYALPVTLTSSNKLLVKPPIPPIPSFVPLVPKEVLIQPKERIGPPSRIITINDFLGGFGISSPAEEVPDIRQLILKTRQVGEEPTTIKTSGYNNYATQADLDFHREKHKSYDVSFSKKEVDTIINHFARLRTMNFYQAREEAKREGMDLWVERIEGHARNKFSNIRPYQMAVTVKDPHPKNGGCPSDEGVVVEITGLVGVNPKY